jgi:polyferredoxin
MSKDEEFIEIWLRWAFNFILLLVLLIATGITMAGFAAVSSFGFWQTLSLSSTIQLALMLVTFFVAVRVLVDTVRLFDRFTKNILRRVPVVYAQSGPRRLLVEAVLLAAISLFSNAAVAFLSSNAPDIIPMLSIIVSVAIMVLAYDVSKTVYIMLQTPIHSLAKMITASEEKPKEG